MKKIITSLTIISIFIGCATSPMAGFLYTDTKHHVNFEGAPQISGAALSKTGESCRTNYFPMNIFVYKWDTTIEEAKNNAGITKVGAIDRQSTSVLNQFLYNKECLIVSGE